VSAVPPSSRPDGDAWMSCAYGHRHWGRYGAAGLLLAARGAVLLQHRALWSHEGGTWGVPGGARASGEAPLPAALREAAEEAGVSGSAIRPAAAWIEDHRTWSYTTVVASAERRLPPRPADAESLAVEWVAVGDVAALPLHPAFGAAWPALRTLLDRRLVLLVDAANVVGSRPDGWWRDRAGAATRLRDALGLLAGSGLPAELVPDAPAAGREDVAAPEAVPAGVAWWWPDPLLVVEGAARTVRSSPTVEVVAAPG
jgi:8-oxo-dGTP diphosphatase